MRHTKRGLYRNWRPVTKEEVKGFIAVTLNIGIIQLGDLKDYWSTEDTNNLPFFRSVFTYNCIVQKIAPPSVGKSSPSLTSFAQRLKQHSLHHSK